MKNAKKLIYIIFFLFLTVLFQIGAIIKLNHLDRQLSRAIALKEEAVIKEQMNGNSQGEDKNGTPDANNPVNPDNGSQSRISTLNDYSDIDTITSDENLKNLFENSLFIGDSRTDAIRKFTHIGNYADFCCDVGTNITKLVTNTFFIRNETITIYDAISKYSYDKIFISIGYNELGWKYEDTFIERYSAFIDEIKRLAPDSEIYVQSIIHITGGAAIANELENNARIDLYNSKISQLCFQKDVHYIDLNPDFTDTDGNLISGSSTDGIHFNTEYCRKYIYKLINSLQAVS